MAAKPHVPARHVSERHGYSFGAGRHRVLKARKEDARRHATCIEREVRAAIKAHKETHR